MMEESPNAISENTEITDRSVLDGLGPFCAATAWGTLIGTFALMISLLFVESGGIGPGEFFAGLAFLGVFVGGFTLAGMLLLGLPVTLVLRAIDGELAWLYAVTGGIAGFLILALLFDRPSNIAPEVLLFAGPGGLAGFVSGLSWGLWREERAATRWREPSRSTSHKRDNPIHDLVY